MNEEKAKQMLQRDLEKNAHTVADFFRICSQHYDVDNAKLGFISKPTLISHIGNIIKMCGAKPRRRL